MSVTNFSKIVEIYVRNISGLSKRRLCKEYVGRKVNNAKGVNLRQNLATPVRVLPLTWLEPAIE